MAIKVGLADAPPLWNLTFRFILAISILHAIVLARRLAYPSTWQAAVRLAHPGIYMYCGSYALVYFAELHISSALTAVLFASFPLFVAILSLRMLKVERLPAGGWSGLILGFLGIVVISYDSLQSPGHVFLGTMLALGGAFSAAYGVLIHKRDFSSENIFVAVALQMTLGGIPLTFGALLFEDLSDFAVTAASVGSILYLATLGTVVTFVSYYWLLARLRVVVVSLIAFITPLVAIFIGAGLFGEELGLRTALGTAMILVGVLLVIRK